MAATWALPDCVALAFTRSPYAHARLTHLDPDAAQAHPGVLTGADIVGSIKPGPTAPTSEAGSTRCQRLATRLSCASMVGAAVQTVARDRVFDMSRPGVLRYSQDGRLNDRI